jgi:hypothetical protein
MPRRKKHSDVSIAPEERFWMHHGPTVGNISELLNVLSNETTDEEFTYHVGKGRNDFAEWIRHALLDSECARTISRVRTRKTMIKTLADCLKNH